MKKIIAAATLFAAGFAFAAEKKPSVAKKAPAPKAEPDTELGTTKNPIAVAEGIWGARTGGGANAGWFLFGDGVVAVDAGRSVDDANALLAAIQKTAGRKVQYLVLTSDFAPHATGAAAFAQKGATIVCQEKVANAVQALINQASATGPAPAAHASSAIVITVSERVILSDGKRTAEIYYPGPADSAGDLLVYVSPQKILFSGDLAETAVLPPLFSRNIDPDGWISVLNRMTKLKVNALVPGYGPIGSVDGLQATGFYVNEAWEIAKRIAKENIPESFIPTRIQEPDVARDLKLPAELQPSHVANVTALVKKIREKSTVPPAP
jgi:glyoxylase-like metal-dependent hydrolase (beta-lactamase superfamily II)